MRYWHICLIVFLMQVLAYAESSYEPRLRSFSIEEGKVIFTLDNDWVFVGKTLDEVKFYALDKLVNQRVYIRTSPLSSLLELTLENPYKEGCAKISYPVSISRESYEELVTVKSIEVNRYFSYSIACVTLSDDSSWHVKGRSEFSFVDTYWAVEDRIIVTKGLSNSDEMILVNLDVSGSKYADYYEGRKGQRYSMKDPCSIRFKRVGP